MCNCERLGYIVRGEKNAAICVKLYIYTHNVRTCTVLCMYIHVCSTCLAVVGGDGDAVSALLEAVRVHVVEGVSVGDLEGGHEGAAKLLSTSLVLQHRAQAVSYLLEEGRGGGGVGEYTIKTSL